MNSIEMVDLKNQYLRIKTEIDAAVGDVLSSTSFIQGKKVEAFERALEDYTGSRFVINCANGTDALIAALLALGIGKNDEVITVPFTFISAVEAISLLGAKPVFVDVCDDTFSMNPSLLENAITAKTKAIIPVHLYGQCADMEKVLEIARGHDLKVVEDACQAIGSCYTFSDGSRKQAGTMSDVGCLSFFPSKNLGCYGDGGAILTQDESLAEKLKIICRHGSKHKYHNEIVGFNSRLDAIQAAILNVKLKYLNDYIDRRKTAARLYTELLSNVDRIITPQAAPYSTHTFHQYTIRVEDGLRDKLAEYLSEHGIPSSIYYPVPAHLQKAYQPLGYKQGDFPVSELLSQEVLSLPMHTELTEEQVNHICNTIISFIHI